MVWGKFKTKKTRRFAPGSSAGLWFLLLQKTGKNVPFPAPSDKGLWRIFFSATTGMDTEYIPDGCILLARKLQESDIWYKPPAWLKIWIYILQEVNHADRRRFKRGENFFNAKEMALFCGVTVNTIEHFMKWAKSAELVAVRKTTRGSIIFVLQYNKYQTLDNYKNGTEAEEAAEQKRNRSGTINKYDKNDKNVRRIETEVVFETISDICKSHALENGVDIDALDILCGQYADKKIHMKAIIPHCLSKLVQRGIKVVETHHIGNWFKKEMEIRKREQLKQLEWKEEQNNPAMAERRKRKAVSSPTT